MNDDALFVGTIFGLVIGVVVALNLKSGYEDFTKEHNKTPYCIKREIGHEEIKKCYIAKEVTSICENFPTGRENEFRNVCKQVEVK